MKKINMDKVVQFFEDGPRAGTLLIAQGFQREHKNILRLVKKHIKRFENLGVVSERKFKSTGGRPVIEYWLNEPQATFLGTLFRNQNDIVLDFKLDLVKRFYQMKKALARIAAQKNDPEYIKARIDGKISRRLETTILKDLVPYSVLQGSDGYQKNPANCYINYTSMTNKALFMIDKGIKNVRNHLDKKQIRSVAVAEDIITDSIIEKIALNMHYKDIYRETKAKIVTYGELIGKSKVPSIEHQRIALI